MAITNLASAFDEEVRTLASAKGLIEIGDQRIGFILAHAHEDAAAPFWPPSEVCLVIEAIASPQIERGFSIECFNKRGVFSRGINEGGDQEREFAERYKNWSNATLGYPRTSAMLMAISEKWNRQADEADIEAEQSKFKN